MWRSIERVQTVERDDVLLGAPMSDVLRVASELYAQDRTQIERVAQCHELKQAAAEAGLPPEYLERAAVSLQAQRMTHLRQQSRRRRGMVAALSLALALGVGFGFTKSQRRAVGAAADSLAGRDLRGVDLSHRNLAGRDLSGSNLRGALLTGSNLRGANLHHADLVGADLRGADLSGADVNYARYSQTTRWSPGYVPQQHHARFVGDGYPTVLPSRAAKP